MKKISIIAIFMFVFHFVSNGQTFVKDDVVMKISGTWSISQYETFGVVAEPNESQANDLMTFNADFTFKIVENGITYEGKYTIQNPNNQYINCKSNDSKFSKVFKIITLGTDKHEIQYKDPDLIKTNYTLLKQN